MVWFLRVISWDICELFMQLIHPYPSGLLHANWDSIIPVPTRWSRGIWVKTTRIWPQPNNKKRESSAYHFGHTAVNISGFNNSDYIISLWWRHNDHDGVSNHQPHDCLLNRLFRRRSKKTSKLRVTGLCVGNSPGTGEFPAQRASNAENVSIWWRHHVTRNRDY